MKVRMRESKICYPDGINEKQCLQGEKYDLPVSIAMSWLKQGFAEEDKVLDVPKETKQKTKKSGKK